jgi:hypothetical protein
MALLFLSERKTRMDAREFGFETAPQPPEEPPEREDDDPPGGEEPDDEPGYGHGV